jgi:ubiquinone/menaquinone biosynthesis C-methylase UbiE
MQNSRRLVCTGYDKIADTYLEQFGVSATRHEWLLRLIERLSGAGACVLDLGCGAGIPVARELVSLGHSVVGVDGSAEQVARARQNVPSATFVQADMCEVQFDDASFDAIGAFYSINHVPAAEQGALLGKLARWLKPGGTLVASLGAGQAGDWTGEWLGTPMFFGKNSEVESLKQLRNAGLVVQQSEVQRQDNEDTEFLWIIAVKAPDPRP